MDIPTVNKGQAALPPDRGHSTTHVQYWAHLSATVTTLTCTLVGGAVSLHRTTHYRPRTTTTEWACMHCTVSPPDTTVTVPLMSEGRSGVVLHQLERRCYSNDDNCYGSIALLSTLGPACLLQWLFCQPPPLHVVHGRLHKMNLAWSCVQLMHEVKVLC